MRKEHRFLLAVVCMAAALAGWALPASDDEPNYNGRSLRQWLQVLGGRNSNGPSDYTNALKAIRHINTNAIPFLLEWMNYDPQPPEHWLPTAKPYGDPSQYALASDAVLAFRVLGPEATSALPSLNKVAASTNAASHRAIQAMSYVGPPALPSLIAIITNGAPSARCSAVMAIGQFGTNARPFVPILIHCLTNSATREAAFKVLAYLKLEPQLVVPAFAHLARDPEPGLRCSAIRMLSSFGQEAHPALPDIIAALQDPDQYVRLSATNTLEQIAPEALTNSAAR